MRRHDGPHGVTLKYYEGVEKRLRNSLLSIITSGITKSSDSCMNSGINNVPDECKHK